MTGEKDSWLKKITEGVKRFDAILVAVEIASNSNRNKKYEADLQKTCEELQKLGDNFKSWITTAKMEDNSSLLTKQKLIEMVGNFFL